MGSSLLLLGISEPRSLWLVSRRGSIFRRICGMGPEYIFSAKKRSSMRRERILNGDILTNE